MFSKHLSLHFLLSASMAFSLSLAAANHGSHDHSHGHDHGHHHVTAEEAEAAAVAVREPPRFSPLAALGDDGQIDPNLPGGSFAQFNQGFAAAPNAAGAAQPLLLEEGAVQDPAAPEKFNPFAPRFEVTRVEIDESEWLQELATEFRSSGILATPDSDQSFFLLKTIPTGVVNINYAIHNCVHMGTQLPAADTVYPPTAISYPTDESSDKLNTLVMIDADNRNRLHWLVVNIPGARVSEGQIVRGYNSPDPAPNTGLHRYVFLAMQQLGGRFDNVPTSLDDICKNAGRDNFDLELFKSRQLLSEPFAANYFTVEFDPFVENITPVCHGPNSRKTLA